MKRIWYFAHLLIFIPVILTDRYFVHYTENPFRPSRKVVVKGRAGKC